MASELTMKYKMEEGNGSLEIEQGLYPGVFKHICGVFSFPQVVSRINAGIHRAVLGSEPPYFFTTSVGMPNADQLVWRGDICGTLPGLYLKHPNGDIQSPPLVEINNAKVQKNPTNHSLPHPKIKYSVKKTFGSTRVTMDTEYAQVVFEKDPTSTEWRLDTPRVNQRFKFITDPDIQTVVGNVKLDFNKGSVTAGFSVTSTPPFSNRHQIDNPFLGLEIWEPNATHFDSYLAFFPNKEGKGPWIMQTSPRGIRVQRFPYYAGKFVQQSIKNSCGIVPFQPGLGPDLTIEYEKTKLVVNQAGQPTKTFPCSQKAINLVAFPAGDGRWEFNREGDRFCLRGRPKNLGSSQEFTLTPKMIAVEGENTHLTIGFREIPDFNI